MNEGAAGFSPPGLLQQARDSSHLRLARGGSPPYPAWHLSCSLPGRDAVDPEPEPGADRDEAGRQQSTAVFLAEQRIEQAKELAARKPNLVDLNTTNLPATEAYGAITGAPSTYRRDTTISLNPGGTTGARVDVSVAYKPVSGRGVLSTERVVSLSIFLANR